MLDCSSSAWAIPVRRRAWRSVSVCCRSMRDLTRERERGAWRVVEPGGPARPVMRGGSRCPPGCGSRRRRARGHAWSAVRGSAAPDGMLIEPRDEDGFDRAIAERAGDTRPSTRGFEPGRGVSLGQGQEPETAPIAPCSGCGLCSRMCATIAPTAGPISVPQRIKRSGVHSRWAW